jgi:hypothetical protein
VTGGGGGAGASVDCLQPADKMQPATAIQHAGFNDLREDLGNFSESQPDNSSNLWRSCDEYNLPLCCLPLCAPE